MKTSLKELTKLIRYDILTSTTEAGTGHPTSSLSAVELMTCIWFDGHLKIDFENPKYTFNDRVIFSKGHASPLLYSLYQAAGVVTHKELMTLRKFDSVLEGHPTPRFNQIDVATGSLGQGLSVGLGMALGIKYQMKLQEEKLEREPKVFVLMGDSEFAEGQIWEALQLASYYKVDNLIGILDVNRLGQRGETMLGWDISTYEKRIASFGWRTVVIDHGNDLEAVKSTLKEAFAEKTNQPTMIIAKTAKGAGISLLSDKENWHGKPLPETELKGALNELGNVDLDATGAVEKPQVITITPHSLPDTLLPELNEQMATREAYGEGLKSIAADPRIVVLDAETSNSTYADKFKNEYPDRFFEMFIAEQNMVSVGLGMSKVGLIPYISSFAAFFSRAYDQIRMGQYSEGNIKIVGSHAGVSIGQDGSSQMALEDLAMMRAILHSVVLYPSDPVSTISLVKEVSSTQGLTYLRLTREKTKSLYSDEDTFPIGGSKVLKSSEKDTALIIAAGITLHEALKAYDLLKKKGINVAIIDAYSIKPLDENTIIEQVKRTGNVIVVEDHYPAGGLGEAVSSLLSKHSIESKFTHLAVRHIPRSGTPAELLRYEEIDAQAIVNSL